MKTTILTLLLAAAALPAAAAIDWTQGVAYDYDAAGNVRRIGSDIHVYDVAHRLVQSDTAGIRRNFGYDGFGNRTKCEQPGTDCQYGHTVIADNRLSGLGYDAAGNVSNFEGHHYEHDLLNMQTSRDADTEYVYTADDERLAVYAPLTGAWRWTLRDSSAKVLREMTSHNGAGGELAATGWTWSRDYVWRDDRLLASRQPASNATLATYHYHVDHLGTPRRITGDTDAIAGVHDYHAFGPEAPGGMDEPSLTPLKYTGHERDTTGVGGAETLDYMHARYYSGMAGRFMEVDPKSSAQPAEPLTWNRYAYARDNPLLFLDPDGRDVVAAANLTKREHARLVNAIARAARDPEFKQRLMAAEKSPLPIVLGPGNLVYEPGGAYAHAPGEVTIQAGYTSFDADDTKPALTGIRVQIDFDNIDLSQNTSRPMGDVEVVAHEFDHVNNYSTREGRDRLRANADQEEADALAFGKRTAGNRATSKRVTAAEREKIEELLRARPIQ